MTIFFVIFGAIVGSFLNVCIYRLPIGRSVISPRSFCPYCQAKTRFFDNIPVLSYIMLLGRCRRCGRKISPQYPFVELFMAVISFILIRHYGLGINYFAFLILVSMLIVVSFIDIRHFIIPDLITIPGIIMGVFFSFFPNYPITVAASFSGLLIGGAILFFLGFLYEKITAKEGIGGGDVKLLALMGAFLGLKAVFVIILVSSVLGTISGLLMLVFVPDKTRFSIIPFGPFLAIGAIVALFYGDEIISFYLRLNYVQ